MGLHVGWASLLACLGNTRGSKLHCKAACAHFFFWKMLHPDRFDFFPLPTLPLPYIPMALNSGCGGYCLISI